MRLIASALFLSALTFSIEASAATISASEPIFASNPADGGSGFIFYLPGFNTSLGTLSSASLRVNGVFDPGISLLPYYGQPPPTAVTLSSGLGLPTVGSLLASNQPIPDTQTVPVVLSGTKAEIRGFPFVIDSTYDYPLRFAADPTPYFNVSAHSSIVSVVGGVGVDNGFFVDVEQSKFNGTATITYTFAVPEPVMLLTFGLLALALVTIRTFPRARD